MKFASPIVCRFANAFRGRSWLALALILPFFGCAPGEYRPMVTCPTSFTGTAPAPTYQMLSAPPSCDTTPPCTVIVTYQVNTSSGNTNPQACYCGGWVQFKAIRDSDGTFVLSPKICLARKDPGNHSQTINVPFTLPRTGAYSTVTKYASAHWWREADIPSTLPCDASTKGGHGHGHWWSN